MSGGLHFDDTREAGNWSGEWEEWLATNDDLRPFTRYVTLVDELGCRRTVVIPKRDDNEKWDVWIYALQRSFYGGKNVILRTTGLGSLLKVLNTPEQGGLLFVG